MKSKALVFTTIILLSLTFHGNSWAQLGIVGDWPLDDGAGTVATDVSGQGNHGTLDNGPVWINGQVMGALSFDGIDDMVNVDDDDSLDVTNALTIMLWVKPEKVDVHQVLVSKNNAYELELAHVTSGKYSARLNNVRYGEGNTTVKPAVWQHLAVTWDGDTVQYYYNGQPDGSFLFDSGPLTINTKLVGLGARGYHFPECDFFYFCGALDEVEIHDEALTDAEILAAFQGSVTDLTVPQLSNGAPAQIFPAGTTQATLTLTTDENATCRYSTTPDTAFADMLSTFSGAGTTAHSALVTGLTDEQIYTYYVRCQDTVCNTTVEDYEITFAVSSQVNLTQDLLMWLRANEGSGCQALDSSGNGANGDLGPNCDTNSPLWVAGAEGTALEIDGTDDEVVVATSTLTAPLSAVSFSAWVKVPAAGGYRSIFDRRDAGTDGYDLYLEPGGRLFLRMNDATLAGETSVADDTWHHVVGVYDGNEMTIYVDGELDASDTVGSKSLGTTADLYIGHHFSVNSYTFSGSLDGLRMYGRALSDIEALAIYYSAP